MSRLLRRFLLPLLACAAGSLAGCGQRDAPLVVRVPEGALRGMAHGSAIAFKGVPYAAPPVGELRWAPPQPPTPWTGERDATRFAAVCPQPANRSIPKGAVQNEDCLTLNIWRPREWPDRAPVLVWVHGGGDVTGDASEPRFDGTSFARDGVVFVSVDYRLGALGWFAHPALTRAAGSKAPLANYGLMDQIAALRWIQANIARFGGDPRRVTLAGQSAGGEAVLTLMSTPAARGLFQQAIVESAPVWAPTPNLATAEAAGKELAQRAGASDAELATLRRLPVSALLAAQGPEAGPIRDGRLVTASAAQAFARGAVDPLPLLIGSNNGEDSLLGQSDPAKVLGSLTPAQVAAVRGAYGLVPGNDAALGRMVFRDSRFGAPARWVAERQSVRAPTFLYRFGYVPTLRRLGKKHAGHGDEISFVFAVMDNVRLVSQFVLPWDSLEMNKVHGCWVSFVKTGRAACPKGPPWSAYDPKLGWLMLFDNDVTSDEPDSMAPVLDLITRLFGPGSPARPG
ncbi:MAG: carboxylesterase family protein [Caulobacteraceae bacterium]|nr:carboxylesterase family protein [Caulobacteraceae bacterium]